MKNSIFIGIGSLILFSVATSAFANGGPDARNFAMGGTGVASSDYLAASFYNPALVTNYKNNDNFGLILPAVSLATNDPSDLIKKINDFQDIYTRVENSDSTVTSEEWRHSLGALNSTDVNIDADAGIAVSVPNKYLGINLFTKAQMNLIVTPNISNVDININPTGPSDLINFSSTITSIAGGNIDVGVALAKSFDLAFEGQKFSVGITPKYQRLLALRYQLSAKKFDVIKFKSESAYTQKNAFNLDLGLAYQPVDNFIIGLAAQNMIKHELEYHSTESTDNSITFLIEPKYIAGIAYNGELFTVAVDVDLNKQNYFKENKLETQFARIGAEFNAWDWAQLRAGYSLNLVDNDRKRISAGVGLTPFGVFGVDISGQYGGGNNYGVALQFILTL